MASRLINLVFCIAAAGLLVLSVMVTPATAAAKAASTSVQGPETTNNFNLPPEPHPGFYKDLDKCLNQITGQCGEQIYLGIFKDHGTVSTGCCNNLVDIGIKCHQSIVLTSLRLLEPKATRDESDKILNKSYLVWSKCVDASMPADDVKPPAISPAYAF